MTSISAPTSLATFSQPHASSSKIPHVTLAPVKGRENLAVASVQGDGIWTYDLTTLRPTTTFTVPPNTTFSTPPISFYPSSRYPFKSSGKQKAEEVTNTDPASLNDIGEDSRLERITVAGVSKGEKVRLEEEGRVLWVWKSEEGIKSSIILDHVVQMIHHVSHHRAHVICVSTHGHITALDSTFQIRPVTLSTYLPNIIASRILSVIGTLVRIALLNDKGEVNVVEIDISGPREMNGQIVKKGDLLEDIKAPQIVSAEIGADGVINIHLGGRKDIFISRSIKSIGSNEKSSLGSHLVHTLTTSPLPLPSAGRPVSLVAVREPELSLLIVSSFGHVTAVLTVSSLTSIAPVADAIVSHLSVVSCSAPGSFIIAVTLAYNGESGSRTAVHTVEVNLPMNGIGMNLLLGSQKATLEHFVPHVQQSQKSTSFETFIASFTDKLAKNEGLASFEKYLKNEENGFTAMGKPITVYQMPDGHVKSVLGAVLNSATKKQAGGSEKIDQESKVVNMLTKRLWVNDEMYSGGVLNTLIALKDWDNAYRMVRTVQTIPSESIVKFIKISISNEGNPTLENVLREILANPIPAPDYRNALRQFLSVEEATLVIEVYSKWLSVHVEKRNEALNGWTEILPESNVLKKGRLIKPKEPVNVSSLHALINHSSVILDSHLPLFLSHPPSYDILQSLQDQLEPLLTLQESYRKLRAPVEAVLTLSRREARKNEEQEKKREVVRLNTNANPSKEKGKKMVGLPDEAVGKWRVEEFIF